MNISIKERIEGCLLAGACGDAIGAPFEFTSLFDMIMESGPLGVGEFWLHDESPGLVSSETQIMLFVCSALLASRYDRSLPEVVHLHRGYKAWASAQDKSRNLANLEAQEFVELAKIVQAQGDRCPDLKMIEVLHIAEELGFSSPIDSQSNSAVARAAPFGLVHMSDPVQAFDLAISDARLTHGHPAGYAAAGGLAMLIALLSRDWSMPKALERVLVHLHEQGFWETSAALLQAPWPTEDHRARPSWYGWGWTGDEALAIAVNAVLTTHSLQAALVAAASHDGDSDTTASIAGNLAGTLYGVRAIPPRWIKGVEMRKLLRSAADQLCQIIPESGWKGTGSPRGI